MDEWQGVAIWNLEKLPKSLQTWIVLAGCGTSDEVRTLNGHLMNRQRNVGHAFMGPICLIRVCKVLYEHNFYYMFQEKLQSSMVESNTSNLRVGGSNPGGIFFQKSATDMKRTKWTYSMAGMKRTKWTYSKADVKRTKFHSSDLGLLSSTIV